MALLADSGAQSYSRVTLQSPIQTFSLALFVRTDYAAVGFGFWPSRWWSSYGHFSHHCARLMRASEEEFSSRIR